jgi:hypothetical protein
VDPKILKGVGAKILVLTFMTKWERVWVEQEFALNYFRVAKWNRVAK